MCGRGRRDRRGTSQARAARPHAGPAPVVARRPHVPARHGTGRRTLPHQSGRRTYGRDPQYAGEYRRRLIRDGLIEPAGHGFVRFTIPYTGDHLREHAAHDALGDMNDTESADSP